jgi:hypothetical protein
MIARRSTRKGSALAAAMLFFVTITIAGTALLSISAIHRIQIVRSGMDVRLMIAAEAGLETARGRFILVPDTQDDWTNLVSFDRWQTVWSSGSEGINGIRVEVEGMAIGSESVPTARIRSIASAGNRSRVVEYTIQVSSFADYSLFFGGTSQVQVGDGLRIGGPVYAGHGMNVQDDVIFYGKVKSGRGITYRSSLRENMFRQGYETNHPRIVIPPETRGFGVMRNAAISSGSLFYRNTIAIRLDGEQFHRTYHHRLSSGAYEVRTITADIPDESVIYISQDQPPPNVDTDLNQNQQSVSAVEIGGTIYNARLTIASDLDILVNENIAYRTLLDKPWLRKLDYKESEDALSFREMLGVVTRGTVGYQVTKWTPFSSEQMVDATANEQSLARQHSIDGILMGSKAERDGGSSGASGRQLWVTGGVLAGDDPTEPLRTVFQLRYFYTDLRLRETLPPYFLRAYGAAPNMVPGTWRTYVPTN